MENIIAKEAKRFYFALTNDCNRECPECCCSSDPTKGTYLSLEKFESILDGDFNFQVQLEGGEPTIHPQFNDMLAYVYNSGRCENVILGTNAAKFPYKYKDKEIDKEKSVESLIDHFQKFTSTSFTIKPSINHHLVGFDKRHWDKCEVIKDTILEMQNQGYDFNITFNVRRRQAPKVEDADQWLIDELEKRGLDKHSNIFYFQRYGYASEREELELPFVVENPIEFYLIDPEGNNWGQDLLKRADYMGGMK